MHTDPTLLLDPELLYKLRHFNTIVLTEILLMCCFCHVMGARTSDHHNKDDIYKWLTVMSHFIGLVGRVFTSSPGDLGSIPGCVIPKTLKMVLDTSLLNTQQYKVCIKGKVEQSWERSSAFPTPKCSSYWKGSLLVALDYSCQLYLLESISFIRLLKLSSSEPV